MEKVFDFGRFYLPFSFLLFGKCKGKKLPSASFVLSGEDFLNNQFNYNEYIYFKYFLSLYRLNFPETGNEQ